MYIVIAISVWLVQIVAVLTIYYTIL